MGKQKFGECMPISIFFNTGGLEFLGSGDFTQEEFGLKLLRV